MHEHHWKYGGTCPQYVSRSGLATAARLGRKNGRYRMLIMPVDVVKQPRERLRESTWERPHTYFRLRCSKEDFFNNVRSNHIHLAYGDHVRCLEEVCNILDIDPLILGAKE